MKKWKIIAPVIILAIIAALIWPRTSENTVIQQIRENNRILQDDTYSYSGRSDNASKASDYIFSDGTNNLYVSFSDRKVVSIRAAAADTLNDAKLTATEEQARKTAETWFLKLFPEAEEIRTDSRETVQAYQVEVCEMNDGIPTGNSVNCEIRGSFELFYANILYQEKEFTSDDVKVTAQEAQRTALSAVNELNSRNYTNVQEITAAGQKKVSCELKVFQNRIYYQIEFTAPIVAENQNHEETYIIQVDARNGKCKSIANTSQNGYDKW